MTLTESKELAKGTEAPSFSLPNTKGKLISPHNYKGKALLIVFMCNHCPYVKPQVEELVRIQKDLDVQVIGINSNDVENYPEDSPKKMKEFVEEYNVNFPYLYDETQEVARSYGAACTPDPFFFNEQHQLIWQGRITSGGQEKGKPELYEAIKEYLSTGVISQKETRSMGCNIKWKE